MNNELDNALSVHARLKELTKTLLYEGYALYPYRNSALKNKTPIPFGVVYPESYGTYNKYIHSKMQTECLLKANGEAMLDVTVKFIQINSTVDFIHNEWQAVEREVKLEKLPVENLVKNKRVMPFTFSSKRNNEEENTPFSHLQGSLTVQARKLPERERAYIISATIINDTSMQHPELLTGNEMLKHAFISTHTILETANAEFISDQNPAAEWKDAVKQCKNLRTWPVLINEENTLILSSPIILYDYPQINADSKGDLFDSTEMEEALVLHINVLPEKEKQQILNGDERLRAMMQKVSDITPEEIIQLHDKLEIKRPEIS